VRIHIGFHRFMKIGPIFQNVSETQEVDFERGACPGPSRSLRLRHFFRKSAPGRWSSFSETSLRTVLRRILAIDCLRDELSTGRNEKKGICERSSIGRNVEAWSLTIKTLKS